MAKHKVFAVITHARPGRTVDIRAREKRYLITMGVRVACFASIAFVPGLWAKLACVLGAAVLPGVAVLLANAVDQRASVVAPTTNPSGLPELPAAEVIPGQVDPPESPGEAHQFGPRAES